MTSTSLLNTLQVVPNLPTGPSASSVLDEICRESGLAIPSSMEFADLSPWSESEAAAFELTINEAFEHVEETPPLS